MALPPNFQTREVHLTCIGLDGTLLSGIASFTNTVTLTDAEFLARIPPKAITTAIVDGELRLRLPRTDDPDISPSFQYKVEIQYNDGFPGESFLLEVPEGNNEDDTLELFQFAGMAALPSPIPEQVLSVAGLYGVVTQEQLLAALGLSPRFLVLEDGEQVPPNTPINTLVLTKTETGV